MPVTINQNKVKFKHPTQQGFIAFDTVASETSQQLQAQLQQKATEIRQSWPENYDNLTDKVNNLVKFQDTAPSTSSTTQVWVDTSSNAAQVAVPTMEEFSDLKSAIDYDVGDIHFLSGSSRTRNIYLDYAVPLSGGERFKVKVLSWNQEVSNRTSIIIYALGDSNTNLGTIDINTIPSEETEFTVPERTYTGIRVYCRNAAAMGASDPDATATARLEFVRNQESYLSEKLGEIEAQIEDVNASVEGVGFAFNVSASSAEGSRNIYCEKSYSFSGGGKIAVRILKWSSLLRQAIRVYVFSGSDSINLGQIPIPYSGDAFYTFDVPDGSYDKVRVAFQNTQGDGVTECQALIVCATDGAVTNGFIDNAVVSLDGIKINCIGDSLTYGYVPSGFGTSPMSPTWCEQLAADLQCTVRNYGITNNAVSNNSGGTGDPMCIRYATMDDDADVVIVMGGTNDFLRVNAPLGTIDSIDNTTFYGAYNVLVQGLLAKYLARKTRIILMVPPMRNRNTEQNTQGTTLLQIQQAVRDIANKYALPYVDWAFDAGISAYLISADTDHVYTYDGIHIQQEIVLRWILPMIEQKVLEVIRR